MKVSSHYIAPITALLCAGMPVTSEAAAMLNESGYWIMSAQNHGGTIFHVSVNDVKSGFYSENGRNDADDTTITIDENFGNITDYAFYNVVTAGTINTQARGTANLISDASTSTGTGGNENWGRFYTDSTPSGSYNLNNHDFNQIAKTAQASVDIDISEFASGSVYVFYGAYRNIPELDFSMTGTGGTVDLLNVGNDDRADNNQMYAYKADFSDAADFDTISLSFINSTAPTNNGRGRIAAVVLTDTVAAAVIPEPSMFSLIGLAGLGMILRRRRSGA